MTSAISNFNPKDWKAAAGYTQPPKEMYNFDSLHAHIRSPHNYQNLEDLSFEGLRGLLQTQMIHGTPFISGPIDFQLLPSLLSVQSSDAEILRSVESALWTEKLLRNKEIDIRSSSHGRVDLAQSNEDRVGIAAAQVRINALLSVQYQYQVKVPPFFLFFALVCIYCLYSTVHKPAILTTTSCR